MSLDRGVQDGVDRRKLRWYFGRNAEYIGKNVLKTDVSVQQLFLHGTVSMGVQNI